MAKMFAGSTPSIFSKVPKPSASFGHLRQLLAGAGEHRFGPRRLPVSLVAQLTTPCNSCSNAKRIGH
jgi:hypothetical protein